MKKFKQKDLHQLVAEQLNQDGIVPFSARDYKPHNIESYISKSRRGLIPLNPDIEKRIKQVTLKLSKNVTFI